MLIKKFYLFPECAGCFYFHQKSLWLSAHISGSGWRRRSFSGLSKEQNPLNIFAIKYNGVILSKKKHMNILTFQAAIQIIFACIYLHILLLLLIHKCNIIFLIMVTNNYSTKDTIIIIYFPLKYFFLIFDFDEIYFSNFISYKIILDHVFLWSEN